MKNNLLTATALTLCMFFQQSSYGQDLPANFISLQTINVEGQTYKIIVGTTATQTPSNRKLIYQDVRWSLYPSINGDSSPMVMGNKGQLLWLRELRITLAPSVDPKTFGNDYELSFSGGSANGFYYNIGSSQILQNLKTLESDSRVIKVEAIRPRTRITQ